jgi:hypothetical protein
VGADPAVYAIGAAAPEPRPHGQRATSSALTETPAQGLGGGGCAAHPPRTLSPPEVTSEPEAYVGSVPEASTPFT